MGATDVAAAVAVERAELADLLDSLTDEQWQAPSLCAGWRVRDVVAHISLPFRYSIPRVLVETIKAGGRFNRMADRRARHDAAMSTADLTAAIRDNLDHPGPPGAGPEGALSHDVIHGLDITVPLGIERKVPEERVRIVLDKNVKGFGSKLTDVQLNADDIDWSFGSGTPLHGSAQDMLLVLCGRKLPPGHLRGTQSARFTSI